MAARQNPPLEVTLRSLHGADGPIERKFVLSPDKPVMIGRASKTANKRLLAASGNAWIDSPVISRNHAELRMNTYGDQHVYLEDLGSMHGTKVNDETLAADTSHVMKNGDVIQFGTSVVRGADTFTPPKYLLSFKPSANIEAPRGRSTLPTEHRSFNRTQSQGYHVPESDSSTSDLENDMSDSDCQISSVKQKHPIALKESGNVPESSKSQTGSQLNPVTILDDTEMVQDSAFVADDNEVRVDSSSKSTVIPAVIKELQRRYTVSNPTGSYRFPSYTTESEPPESDGEAAMPEATHRHAEDERLCSLYTSSEHDFEAEDKVVAHSEAFAPTAAEMEEGLFHEELTDCEEYLSDVDEPATTAAMYGAGEDELIIPSQSAYHKMPDDVANDTAQASLRDASTTQAGSQEPSNSKVHTDSYPWLEQIVSEAEQQISKSSSVLRAPIQSSTANHGFVLPQAQLNHSKNPAPIFGYGVPQALAHGPQETNTIHPQVLGGCPSVVNHAMLDTSDRYLFAHHSHQHEGPFSMLPHSSHEAKRLRTFDSHIDGNRPHFSNASWSVPSNSHHASKPGRPTLGSWITAQDPLDSSVPFDQFSCAGTSAQTLPPYRSLVSQPAPLSQMPLSFEPLFKEHNVPQCEYVTSNEPSAKPVNKFDQPVRSKTGISITEIVEPEPVHPASAKVSKKRKAAETDDAVAGATIQVHTAESHADVLAITSMTGPPVSTAVEVLRSVPAKSKRPSKRVRLQLVATATAGALVGSLGMLATLAALPDGFFQ